MENTEGKTGRLEADAAQATVADLRLRLRGSQGQEQAARAEARRFAREGALMRRLLAFSHGGEVPARPRRQVAAGPVPSVRAVCLTTGAIFTLDACQRDGPLVRVSGWAFHPAQTWNGLTATVTVLFRQGLATHAAGTGRLFRPDVATHFATQPDEASGGARGLAYAGFASEIAADSLPQNVELDVVLRLECEGAVCEQPTGRRLRL